MRKSGIKDQLSSPFAIPHPMFDIRGDKRDIHTDDLTISQTPKGDDNDRERSPCVFKEGTDRGMWIGPVNTVAKDVVSSPMCGPRRDSTGERDSELGKKQGY